MSEQDCVCGFRPPGKPNPDCERCQFVCRIAELEGQVATLREALETSRDILNRCFGDTPLDVQPESIQRHSRQRAISYQIGQIEVALAATEPGEGE